MSSNFKECFGFLPEFPCVLCIVPWAFRWLTIICFVSYVCQCHNSTWRFSCRFWCPDMCRSAWILIARFFPRLVFCFSDDSTSDPIMYMSLSDLPIFRMLKIWTRTLSSLPSIFLLQFFWAPTTFKYKNSNSHPIRVFLTCQAQLSVLALVRLFTRLIYVASSTDIYSTASAEPSFEHPSTRFTLTCSLKMTTAIGVFCRYFGWSPAFNFPQQRTPREAVYEHRDLDGRTWWSLVVNRLFYTIYMYIMQSELIGQWVHHTISLMYVGARHLEFGITSHIVT